MEALTSKEQVDIYTEYWREIDTLYEDYAKSVGLSFTSFQVLEIIYSNQQNCTQKTICQQTLLPKQTVNTIITAFLKQGLIVLTEIDSDRRNKAIQLTEAGKEHTEKIIPKIRSAECMAMEKLDCTQRTALIDNTKLFKDSFRECLSAKDVVGIGS